MGTRRLSIIVEATPEEVFDLIHDYDARLTWDPFLRRAELLGDATTAGKGVEARCVARWSRGGLGMDVVYLSFERPRVAAIEMVRGPWPVKTFHASLRQLPVDDGRRTEVTYAFHFTLWGEPATRPMRPLFEGFFANETRGRLDALRVHFARHESRVAEPASA